MGSGSLSRFPIGHVYNGWGKRRPMLFSPVPAASPAIAAEHMALNRGTWIEPNRELDVRSTTPPAPSGTSRLRSSTRRALLDRRRGLKERAEGANASRLPASPYYDTHIKVVTDAVLMEHLVTISGSRLMARSGPELS